jgi:hypothetical protein
MSDLAAKPIACARTDRFKTGISALMSARRGDAQPNLQLRLDMISSW